MSEWGPGKQSRHIKFLVPLSKKKNREILYQAYFKIDREKVFVRVFSIWALDQGLLCMMALG